MICFKGPILFRASSCLYHIAMMKGKFTLREILQEPEALNKMGPLKQIMGMLPLGNMELPEGVYDVTSTKMVRYRIIMDSMTPRSWTTRP